VVPKVTLVGFLVDRNSPNAVEQSQEMQAAARTLGIELRILEAKVDGDFDTAFASLVQQRVGALILSSAPLFLDRRDQLVALAARDRIPAMFAFPEDAAAGGLMSYCTNLADVHRQVGIYAGRILKGEKPSDLPVVQPTKFEFAINLGTARALGIEVPETLLATADKVIE